VTRSLIADTAANSTFHNSLTGVFRTATSGLGCDAVLSAMMTLGGNHPRHNRQWSEPAGIWEARPGLQSRRPCFIIEALPKHARSEAGSESGAGICNFAGCSGLIG